MWSILYIISNIKSKTIRLSSETIDSVVFKIFKDIHTQIQLTTLLIYTIVIIVKTYELTGGLELQPNIKKEPRRQIILAFL